MQRNRQQVEDNGESTDKTRVTCMDWRQDGVSSLSNVVCIFISTWPWRSLSSTTPRISEHEIELKTPRSKFDTDCYLWSSQPSHPDFPELRLSFFFSFTPRTNTTPSDKAGSRVKVTQGRASYHHAIYMIGSSSLFIFPVMSLPSSLAPL